MFKSIALVVLCVYAVATKELVRSKRSSGLIVDGRNAGRGKYPQFAIIYYDGEFDCGGTILNKKNILTAAHCIFADASEYSVAVGKYTMNRDQGSEQYLDVDSITVHEAYSLPDNDIAILHLKQRITYDEYVQPVDLAKSKDYLLALDPWTFYSEEDVTITRLNANEKQTQDAKSEVFENCTAIGVGEDSQGDDGSATYPRVLQELETTVVSRKRCKKLVQRELGSPANTISKYHLCTFDDNAGVCFGDSGGPFGCFDDENNFVQMGLLSFGSPLCVDGFNVFTRVSQYKTWIKDNMV